MTMRQLHFERVLVLGAHTDDEFGCSGILIRLLQSGANIHYAVFSTCEESVPPGYPKDVLAQEVRRATQALGLLDKNLMLYNYRVRHFPDFRQDILEDLTRLRNALNPDLVLLPTLSDIHQDHHVIASEGIRAFKFASILGYELPMNTITFRHTCFAELNDELVQRKVDAARCYESQQSRPYMNGDFIRSLARVRGVQAGVEYAEAFEVLRLEL